MFCGKCGAKNNEGAVFCYKCGKPLNDEQEVKNEAAHAKTNNRNRNVGIISVAAIVAAVLVVIFYLFGGRSYKTTVKKYLEASKNGDVKTILKLIPEDLIEKLQEEKGLNKNELVSEMQENMQEEMDTLNNELGDDWKFTYDIQKVKDVSDKNLKEIKKDYKECDVDVTAAKNIEVKCKVKWKDNENTNTANISVIKIGRNWYIDASNTSF